MKRIISDFERDWPGLSMLVAARWLKKPTPFVVILKACPKTHEQLGYFHATVLPPFTKIMFDSGEITKSQERHAKYWLKRHIGYGEWIEYNGGTVFDADSFEYASAEVLSEAIDTAILQAEMRGVYIPPPRTNKKEVK